MKDALLLKFKQIPFNGYFELCKPKVVLLILFTALVGMLLSTQGSIPLDLFFFAVIAIPRSPAYAHLLTAIVYRAKSR